MAALNLLDIESLASIEYSVTANSSAHIVLLHSDIATINAWETELMKKSDIICNAVVEGRLEITATVYDSQTGMATPVRHLVNEEMAKDS
jgi:hypothetical protein